MQTKRTNLKHPITILVAGTLLLLVGCATPPAIKTASKAQCELNGELDQSLQALKSGLVQFESDNQDQIRQVGRVLLAKQAINVILESGAMPVTNGMITVDDLFKTSNERIRPYVDNAFIGIETNQVIEAMNATTNAALRNLLLVKLNGLKVQQASLAGKPQAVADLEKTMQDEIAGHQATAKEIKTLLDTVRAQNGLMKVVATTIDAWLDQDVTITKAQADNLETAIVSGQKAIGGGK